MYESLFAQALDLLVYGMGTVYLFLAVLIGVTVVMSRLVTRFFPEPQLAPRVRSPEPQPLPVDEKTLRIIKAALDQHRARQ